MRGAAESLNKEWYSVLVDIEGVEVLAIESCKKISTTMTMSIFSRPFWHVGVRILLILDPPLNILIIEVEFFDSVIVPNFSL